MAQAVEHLPSNHEGTLGSIPSIARERERERERERGREREHGIIVIILFPRNFESQVNYCQVIDLKENDSYANEYVYMYDFLILSLIF
jgi:hypothetical protein